MELDELKMAWGQFNDKINGQELVGRQQLKQMLAKKKMSNYSRLLWYERISLGFLFFVFLGLFCLFSDSGAFLLDECSNDALYCCSGGFGSESIPILQIETSGVYEK